MISSYPIDGAIGVRVAAGFGNLMVCLHNNAIDARCILVTRLHCGTPEARLSAIYIVNSVGTSHMVGREFASGRVIPKTIIKW